MSDGSPEMRRRSAESAGSVCATMIVRLSASLFEADKKESPRDEASPESNTRRSAFREKRWPAVCFSAARWRANALRCFWLPELAIRAISLESWKLRLGALHFPLIGASAHDCCVMMKGSGVTLISPRNGQSSAMIITITSASVAATIDVIARCRPKFSKPKR